ncbi:hypothetical protein ANN_04888 [Periplaneta americana]|uniref:Uncharacterized protein n=1 Tax=Periplaneta americana TaxID=6978 RepID=A0ABQ8TC16_PERAM|nr:hypothetical protein ANN_04888 [Periplaneta americana]
MAGLCEGGNEPPGSLKAIKLGLNEALGILRLSDADTRKTWGSGPLELIRLLVCGWDLALSGAEAGWLTCQFRGFTAAWHQSYSHLSQGAQVSAHVGGDITASVPYPGLHSAFPRAA